MSRFNAVFRIRDFRTLVLAQFVSLFGDHIYFLVLLFIAKEVSKSNLEVGIVMTAQALPFLVLSPVAGVVADRFDRRKIMASADLVSAVLTLSLVGVAFYFPQPPIWLIATYGFFLSTVNAFFMPARMAALPRLVPQQSLVEANAFFITMQQVVAMIGVALAATVLGFVYDLVPGSFLMIGAALNALTFGFSAYWVLRLPSLVPIGEPHTERSGFGDFKEGLRAVGKDGILRVILPTMFLYQMFIAGFMVVYVEANKAWFGGRFSTFAWIEFSFAASMAVMGLAIGRFRLHRPGLAFGVAIGLIGLCVAMMAWAENFWIFVIWNSLAGLAFPFAWLPIQVYVQSAFEDRLRGRVNSALITAQTGAQPFGLLAVGPLLDLLGLKGIFLAMGIGMALPGFGCLLIKSCRDGEIPDHAENGRL